MKANQQKYKCYINNICIFMCTVYIYMININHKYMISNYLPLT